jgi:hypothetical protein
MMKLITKGNASAGAIFSDCDRYRYRLWRVWDASLPRLCFVMLNPSRATHEILDPTVTRCQKRAQSLGYGGLEVVNIFALRSTDPKALYEVDDPVGKENITQILRSVNACAIAICAWGTHGNHLDMGQIIKVYLGGVAQEKTHYLKLNADGSPAHPLYLPYSLKPVLWDVA